MAVASAGCWMQSMGNGDINSGNGFSDREAHSCNSNEASSMNSHD